MPGDEEDVFVLRQRPEAVQAFGAGIPVDGGLAAKDAERFVGLGPLALNYILEVGGSGYFRMSAVQPFLNTGALHLVPDTPEFSYPAYAVYGTNAEPTLIGKALDGLRKVAKSDTESAGK